MNATIARLLGRLDAAVLEVRPEGQILSAAGAVASLTGYAPEELAGRNFWEVFFPGELQGQIQPFLDQVHSQDVRTFPLQVATAGGEEVLISVMTANQYSQAGALELMVVYARLSKQSEDERSQVRSMQRSLLNQQESLGLIFASIRDYAIFTLDPEGHVTSWNLGAETFKGYKEEEILGKSFRIFYPPEMIAAGIPERNLRIAAAEGRYEAEGWRVRKDGSQFWANVVISALRTDSGELRGFVKITRDITRRKQAEEALKHQAEVVRLLQEVTVAANEAVTVESAFQFALDRICAFTGWKLAHAYRFDESNGEELISMNLWSWQDGHNYEQFRSQTRSLHFKVGVGLPGMVYAHHSPVWIEDISHHPEFLRVEVSDAAGLKTAIAFPVIVGKRISGVLEFFTDQREPVDYEMMDIMSHIGTQLGRVVERVESETALRLSESRFRTIFEGAGLGIQLVDMEGHLLESNPALWKMLGYDAPDTGREEAYPKGIHPANVVARLNAFNEMRQGRRRSYHIERPYLRKDGQLMWGRLSISLVENEEGKPQYAVAMLEDITERKQLEAELAELRRRMMEWREGERLELAKELHDGPVQDLYGLRYHLNSYLAEVAPEPSRSVKEIQDTLQNVIRKLLTVSGELRPPTLAPFGLEKAIRSHADLFEENHPELHVYLDLMPDEQSLPDPVRLVMYRIYQQALNNIVRHAWASNVWITLKLDEENVLLEIRDDGVGFVLPPRWIKLARQGHLGLVNAAERAEAIGGKLEIITEPGQGTVIRAVVPRQGVRNSVA